MMGDPHCPFSSAWGSRSSSLLLSCCVFDSESTCGGHLLSSWVHPSICVIVVGSLLLLNLCCCCWICIMVAVVKSVLLLWHSNLWYCWTHCGCWIWVVVIESASSGFCHWTLGIVKLVSLLSNSHHPDLGVFAGHLWRLACAENWVRKIRQMIMGNRNTPCSCDSPSQLLLLPKF